MERLSADKTPPRPNKDRLDSDLARERFAQVQNELGGQVPSMFDAQADEQSPELLPVRVWESVKSLESKYIDLANYYKEELVALSQPSSSTRNNSASKESGTKINFD